MLTLIFGIRASEPPPPPGPGERLKRQGLIGLTHEQEQAVFYILPDTNEGVEWDFDIKGFLCDIFDTSHEHLDICDIKKNDVSQKK